MEGVLVTGTARATLTGECARCLEPLTEDTEVGFQELFVYEDHALHGEDAGDDEVSTLEGDLVDLEPLLRDAVVLALPFQPLCMDDCPGLCPDCGARLADDPGHAHEARGRPTMGGADRAADQRRLSKTDKQEKTSGSPEAEDVAQQHASPSLGLEGQHRRWSPVRTPPAEPSTSRTVRAVRPVRRPRGPSSGPLELPVEPTLNNYAELRAALGDLKFWTPGCSTVP